MYKLYAFTIRFVMLNNIFLFTSSSPWHTS